jgi:hypothetical protein
MQYVMPADCPLNSFRQPLRNHSSTQFNMATGHQDGACRLLMLPEILLLR